MDDAHGLQPNSGHACMAFGNSDSEFPCLPSFCRVCVSGSCVAMLQLCVMFDSSSKRVKNSTLAWYRNESDSLRKCCREEARQASVPPEASDVASTIGECLDGIHVGVHGQSNVKEMSVASWAVLPRPGRPQQDQKTVRRQTRAAWCPTSSWTRQTEKMARERQHHECHVCR